jgi:hypothetical protein
MLTSAAIVYVVMACTTKTCAPAEVMPLTDPIGRERCARDAWLQTNVANGISYRCVSRRVPVEDIDGR